MIITCQHCGFHTETFTEDFRINRKDLNFCMKCGSNYSREMIERMYHAEETSILFSQRWIFSSILVITFGLILLALWVGFTGYRHLVTPTFKVVTFGIMAVLVILVAVVIIGMFIQHRMFKRLSATPSKQSQEGGVRDVQPATEGPRNTKKGGLMPEDEQRKQQRQIEAVARLRTKDGFEKFLQAADRLRDANVPRRPRRDSRILEEVMNFRYTF